MLTVPPLFSTFAQGDLVSALLKQKLVVQYTDNPQKDSVDLVRLYCCS